MTTKIQFPTTWGYEDFITKEEQIQLVDWACSNLKFLGSNGPGRFFGKISELTNSPDLLQILKKRIITLEGFQDYKNDPFFGDFISFNFDGAEIHEHIDPNEEGRVHTRYNLLICMPETGGIPIYDKQYQIPVKEKMLWRCVAGKYYHKSTTVVGNRPRINISFGFSLPQ